MSAADDAGAAGGAGADAAAAEPAAPVSLEILETTHTAQIQNGLRHSDYSRYRQYCARRLRRLRTGKSVRWTHGKGKKFVGRTMTPGDVKDPRHLSIVLFNAERAWAGAMEVKQAAGSGDNVGAVARAHMMTRFKKAVAWAEQLEALARERGDARTSLEAEAYSCFHAGALCTEMEAWPEGLEQFASARRIYEQLSTVAPKRAKQLYTMRITEIATQERFCRYQIGRAGGTAPAPSDVADPPGLAKRVSEALAQTLAARFDGVHTVYWKGSIIPVRSDRVRAALSEARAAQTAAAGGAGGGSVELVTRWLGEGSKAAATDAAAAAREGKDALAADCRALSEYCLFMRGRAGLTRATGAAQAATATAAGDEAAPAAAGGAAVGKGKADAAGAAAPPSSADAFATSTYHTAVRKAGAGANAGRSGGRKGEGHPAGAATAAVGAYNRALKTLDDMAALLGGPLAPHAAEGPAPGAGGAAAAAMLTELPAPPAEADAQSLRCLFARQACTLAWRCWAVSLVAVHGQRYADASALLGRTKERAAAALKAYAALTTGAGSAPLPAGPIAPGSPEAEKAEVPLSYVLTGVSQADVASLQALLTLTEARGVSISSTGLIESLGPAVRNDEALVGLYKAAMAAPGLVKEGAAADVPALARSTDRPAWLSSRAGGFSLAEATDSPSAVSPFPPALLPVPAKPFLFDLAFNGVRYPQAVQEGADAVAAKAAAGEAAGGAGGGLLSWITGR